MPGKQQPDGKEDYPEAYDPRQPKRPFGGLPSDLAAYLDSVASVSPIPVCAGFGIRAAKDVRDVGKHAAGAIVGSALVEVLERGEDPAAFLNSLLSSDQ